jgi:type II secretory pathway pseudopilin PulG
MKFKLVKPIPKQSGFTLIEIIFVGLFTVVLAGLIIPNIIAGPSSARDSQRKAAVSNTLRGALESFYIENGNFPQKLDDLTTGATPYLRTLPTDPRTKDNYQYTPIGSPATGFILVAQLENQRDKQAKPNSNGLYEIKVEK